VIFTVKLFFIMPNRRIALKQLASGASLLATGALAPLFAEAQGQKRRFKIGACDWSIDGTAQVAAIETAKKIGLDGVQLSLGTVANDMHLRRSEVQQAYKAACKQFGVEVGGLAIGELNEVPYKSDPRTEAWVADCIDVAVKMKAKVILLAFFSKGDLRDDPAGKQVVIERLKKVAPKAEQAGVILGIESWLSAQEHIEIINAVGSRAVQVYYDVCNSSVRGYNIYEEIRWLGREQICEFHFKENDALLGKGIVDFAKVRQVLDQIGYEGWIQIEGAVPPGATMLDSYRQNNQFVRDILGV
jgi:L-ribulose-5-phosphate 3-epimerase